MSKYLSGLNLDDQNSTLTMIFNKIKEKSFVFDVGCASGYLAEALFKKKGCKVVGLEIDEADAKLAEKYCEFVLRDDIETNSWEKKLESKKFDHIIFADVLEHLKDPEKVLVRVKNFLKPDGSILVSIPNIAHVSVRLELLGGKFVPESTGILDNTHLKYFTKETFSNLAKNAGYKINDLFQTTFDFPETKINEILSKLGLSASEKMIKELASPEAVAYEYFFELKIGKTRDAEKIYEENKPIYHVRNFLKSVELDHAKFKEEEIKNRRVLEKKNQELNERIDILERKLSGSFIYKLKRKVKRLMKAN